MSTAYRYISPRTIPLRTTSQDTAMECWQTWRPLPSYINVVGSISFVCRANSTRLLVRGTDEKEHTRNQPRLFYPLLQIAAGTAAVAAEVAGEVLVEGAAEGVLDMIVPGMSWVTLWRVGRRIRRGERRPGDRRRLAFTATRLFFTGGVY